MLTLIVVEAHTYTWPLQNNQTEQYLELIQMHVKLINN